jgi:adenylate cyclase
MAIGRVIRAFSRRMVVKLFVATAALVAASLLFLAFLQTRAEMRSLAKATEVSALQIADLVVGSVEHAMLQGDGITVKELIKGFKQRVPDAQIHVFDRRGQEVFGEPAPAPAASAVPAPLREALDKGARLASSDGRIYRPVPNQERCHVCHDPAPALRGVLAFTRDEAVLAARREDLAADLVRAGFVQIMTAKQAERLDDYFGELSALAPTILAVGVYDREGDLAFGKDVPGLTPELLAPSLSAGAARRRVIADGAGVTLVPLPREDRCAQCHKDKAELRGALAEALAKVPAGGQSAEQELEVVIDTSLRHIMMSSLGRIIAEYLWDVAESGAVKDLTLYDARGAVWFSSMPAAPENAVQLALAATDSPPKLVVVGSRERVQLARRLENDPKRCISCHGSDHAVRGVVMVSLPNDEVMAVRDRAERRTLLLTGGALALVLAMLFAMNKLVIDRPVRAIGAAADAVGQGDLAVEERGADAEGDELRQLGARINEMIHGLRTKFVLEKFVSKGTVQAAKSTAVRTSVGQAAGQAVGERRHLTVLFSDIRGFTAYSETVPPEQVVEMLNAFLDAQTTVVERWRGDVDKFVGDELMAIFEGADAARRAVRCAVEMLEAVAKLRRPGQDLAVGVGISSGDVGYGPIGAKDRLDFTVIGDVVNTGARLCGAAEGGQVLVARPVIDDCRGGLGDIEFNALAPMKVKNKREPLEVYCAARTEGGQ